MRDGARERALRGVAAAARTAARRTPPLLLIVVLALSACTSSSPASGPGRATAAPSPSASPTPDAAGMLTEDFDNGAPCPASADEALPAGAGCVSEAVADLDGDGTPDRFLLYADLKADGTPARWRALAVLSSSGTTKPVPVPTGQGVATIYPRVIGAADANGDGRPEVFVKLSAILYHVGGEQIEGIYGIDGGHVRPVRAVGKGFFTFRAGGISRYGDGALCTDADGRPVFLVRHVEQVLPASWQRTQRTFAWRGLSLRQVAVHTDRKPLTLHLTDPPIDPYYRLQCGPVHA